MATLVFRTTAGALLQTQVGTADVIAVVSLSRSICGWVGGLDNVRSLLSHVPNIFSEDKARKLAKRVELGPAVGYLFTQNGHARVDDERLSEPFGGDPRTQLLGLSICALAHECGDTMAVDLFMQHLGPALFKASEASEALFLQLKDNRSRIVNEGAARGLTNTFNSAISDLNLSSCGVSCRSHDTEGEQALTDINYIVGLLKWLIQEKKETYFTRSSVVLRVAACLKAVGYFIGQIQCWNGSGSVPRSYGSNSVILVTGGHHETDILLDGFDGSRQEIVHHYRFETVGSLLSNAMRNQSDIRPEVFQSYFEDIASHTKQHLSFRWTVEAAVDFGRYYGPRGSSLVHNHGKRTVRVRPEWAADQRRPSPISVRLASIYFKTIAEHVAPCYESISTAEVLQLVLEKQTLYMEKEVPKDLVTFRVITASIIIAFAGQLSAEDFRKTQHCTCLNLTDSSWLACTAAVIDRSASEGLKLGDATFLLAAIHAGCPEDLVPQNGSGSLLDSLVGWRNGTYSVIPSVVMEMTPNPQAIGFRCFNGFWANAVVQKSGAVVSGPDRTLYVNHKFAASTSQAVTAGSLQSFSGPYTGPPARGPPDVPLYLNIERSPSSEDPELCFCGRINGTSVGDIGVTEVITTLVASHEKQNICKGHAEPLVVVNIKASDWVEERLVKPVGQWDKHHTFVPVQHDPCWALFIAGQASYFDGRLSQGCMSCTAESMIEGSVIVGYE